MARNMAKQEYFKVINSKLKAGLIIIVFLLLLGLDAPEFIVCSYNLPDEILDIPRVLLDRNQLLADFHIEKLTILKEMLRVSPLSNKKWNHPSIGNKNGSFGSQGLTNLHYAAEIRKQYLGWEYNYQQDHGKQDHGKEETSLIKDMNLSTMFATKFNKISSFPLPLILPTLRI